MGYFGRANFSKFATEYKTVEEAKQLYELDNIVEEKTTGNRNKVASKKGDIKQLLKIAETDAKSEDSITNALKSATKNKYPVTGEKVIEYANTLEETIKTTEEIKEITDKNVELYKVDMELLNLNIKNEYVINIKTGELYKLEGVEYKEKTYHNLKGVEIDLPDETERELIELNVVINQETDEMYRCLLTFKSTDENDKIKQIEYLKTDGEEPIVISIDKDGKQEISIDYDIEKTDIDTEFKITTIGGKTIVVNTAYTVIYDDNMGEIFKEEKILKGSIETISTPNLAPTKEGKHFLGWSKDKTATKPDYFENGEYTVNDKNIRFYAIWTDEQNGKTENLNNDSLIGKVSKINTSGIQNISVNGVTYSANIIVENNDLVLDGEKEVTGATLTDKVYEFGNKETDVARANADGTVTDAQNMVILKVNGNLTINYHTTLTACKSDDGYGGPKGLLVYCTGTLSNNGIIDMTARGARAEGQNVYLWKNNNNTYEYIPAEGGAGGEAVLDATMVKNNTVTLNGIQGIDGNNRGTGGGGSGGLWISRDTSYSSAASSGAGSSGTSYSGGSGGGSIHIHANGEFSAEDGNPNGGAGGSAYAGKSKSSWADRYCWGGAGNPGGKGSYNGYPDDDGSLTGDAGTGGLLVIYANTINSVGKILSNGSVGGLELWGGSSGGGSINIFARAILECIEPTANGGAKGLEPFGGEGGNGSITIGSIATGTFVKDEDKNENEN